MSEIYFQTIDEYKKAGLSYSKILDKQREFIFKTRNLKQSDSYKFSNGLKKLYEIRVGEILKNLGEILDINNKKLCLMPK